MTIRSRILSADGLLRLDAARKALRHRRITSPEQFRASDADMLASINGEALATIRRVLDGGDPVAARLLFWDAEAEGIEQRARPPAGQASRTARWRLAPAASTRAGRRTRRERSGPNGAQRTSLLSRAATPQWPKSRLEEVSQSRLRGEEAQGDEGAGEVKQAGEDVGATFVTGGEAAMAGEPGDRAFDRPAMPAQALR